MQTHIQSTLLELVSVLNSFTNSEYEVVALATYLVNSGQVRLCGTFAGATIEPVLPTCRVPLLHGKGIVNVIALTQYQGEGETASPPLSLRRPGLES
jgi:hypothetical protein